VNLRVRVGAVMAEATQAVVAVVAAAEVTDKHLQSC
jgi:hypothetical protein